VERAKFGGHGTAMGVKQLHNTSLAVLQCETSFACIMDPYMNAADIHVDMYVAE
jgi:hypothetical protein